jgi:aminoglycoside phosphotransferase (APT) family kinase protein
VTNLALDKAAITPGLVEGLVASQFPDWAGLPVRRVELDGWDNATFRLGDDLSVRLPSADGYVPQVEKEHRWLPVLAPQLPLPIPEPVAQGEPGLGFPRPWSVYRWLRGEHASPERVADPVRFAADLAGFLAALYAIDATGGPKAGAHSFYRGSPLTVYDPETRESIETLRDEVDAEGATAVWEAALAAPWRGPDVWLHGDVTASNLLVEGGRLSAVIDFGCSAVGDPACDTTMAWTFFSGESRAAFRAGVPLDERTWARGRGWALWKALNTIRSARARDAHPDDVARRFAWRLNAHGVIDEVLADHAAVRARR